MWRPLCTALACGALALAWCTGPGVQGVRAQAAVSGPPAEAAPAARTFLGSLEPYERIYLAHSRVLKPEGEALGYDDDEVLIQFSFKKQLVSHLYFGYSQRSFWQVYDEENSRPIRENNYNPELFLEYHDRWGADVWRFGLWEHESNGGQDAFDAQGNRVNLSRTWNRAYVYAARRVLLPELTLAAKLWVVTDQADEESSSFGVDNPDIRQFLGSGELYAELGSPDAGLALMLRRGTRSGTGTVRLEAWLSYDRMAGSEGHFFALYFQAFSGYGDSLIDYNRKIERVALGFTFR